MNAQQAERSKQPSDSSAEVLSDQQLLRAHSRSSTQPSKRTRDSAVPEPLRNHQLLLRILSLVGQGEHGFVALVCRKWQDACKLCGITRTSWQAVLASGERLHEAWSAPRFTHHQADGMHTLNTAGTPHSCCYYWCCCCCPDANGSWPV